MKIKVCGITDIRQFEELTPLSVDYAGFVFYKNSPRNAADKIDKKQLKSIQTPLQKVGVFVNEDTHTISKTIEEYGLDVIQLHGSESPEFCSKFSETVKVIKVFSVPETGTVSTSQISEYKEVCDYFLFDTATSDGKRGGTGKTFDWNKIRHLEVKTPFFLSGGIGVSHVKSIQEFSHPQFWGVDINSEFELSPGIKNLKWIERFSRQIKK